MVCDENSRFGEVEVLVKIPGVNALLPMLHRLSFSKSFQSDNHVYYDLNNNTFLSSFIQIVLISETMLVVIVQLLYDIINQVHY